MGEHKKNLINLIKKFSYRHDLWSVYSDFLEISAIAISNTIDILNRDSREKRYLELIKKYSKEEVELFPLMIGELVMELEENPTDALGEVFMEMEMGNSWKGQFFTPMSICKACGAITAVNAKQKINELGFITVSEPACGGGAMVIGLALALKDEGINYQQSMVVTAVDIDIKAVHMAYIQLSLLGIPAIICHGNTLTVEVYSQWYTPIYKLNGWIFKKQKQPGKVIGLRTEKGGQVAMVV